MMGIFVGILSYYLQVTVKNDIGLLGFMLMLAGVVVQRHIFMLMHHRHRKTGRKRLVLPGIYDICVLVHVLDTPALTACPLDLAFCDLHENCHRP